jgi:hypothetical protein
MQIDPRSHGSARFASEAGFIAVKEQAMGKGMDRKKEQKKKPAKTLEEKRAAKKAKRESKG